MAMTTLTASAPYVGGILFTLIAGWIVAVGRLGKRFNAMTTQPEKQTVSHSPELTSMCPLLDSKVFPLSFSS